MAYPKSFMLEAQRPAEGVHRHATWGDATVYTVECDCTDPDHGVTVWYEFDAEHDHNSVEMTVYVEMFSPRFGNLWERIKWSMACLFKGHVRLQHDMILTSQSAKNFASTLDDAAEIYGAHREKDAEKG